MSSINIFIYILLSVLMCKIVGGRDIGPVIESCREEFSKNVQCCTPTPPEDFKHCVTQKRRPLPAPYLGFKSISCQCHTTPGTTGVRTQTRWVQTYRQCLFTDEDVKERAPARSVIELFQACEDGNLMAVQDIISAHPEKINAEGQHSTPIMTAAAFGKTDVFNFLACHTCKWNVLDNLNNSMLHVASFGGSLEIVKRVLSLRLFKIDSRGEWGRTALLLAVRNGYTDVAELIIQNGCDVMVRDCFENNMLHLACKSKNITLLKYVMAKDIFSLESRTINGRTPLLVAAERAFPEGCDYLIQQGADVTAVDTRNNTLLHQVVFIYKETGDVLIELMQHFLSKGYVDKESRGENGRTPLLLASKHGYVGLVKFLVNKGCNTTAVDDDGDTMLHLAIVSGRHHLVEHMLDKGYISPSARGAQGKTALMFAAQSGFVDIFDLLIKKGCNITLLDDHNATVLHWACRGGHYRIIKHILSENILGIDTRDAYGFTPLMIAIGNGHFPAFKLMLRKGSSTTMRDGDGNSVLHLACVQGSKNMVKLLMELKPAKRLIGEKNAWGQTPIQLARARGFTDIVNILDAV